MAVARVELQSLIFPQLISKLQNFPCSMNRDHHIKGSKLDGQMDLETSSAAKGMLVQEIQQPKKKGDLPPISDY